LQIIFKIIQEVNEMVIGVVGGMGSYATLHFFRRYLEVFPAVKEWERPRIIIDNRCTMPSRVRAILLNENVDNLVNELTDSVRNLAEQGCDHIILACGTSHVFLDRVFEKAPEVKSKVMNILEICAENAVKAGLTSKDKLSLLATEGSIQSKIYEHVFAKYSLKIVSPKEEELVELRYFIEAAKMNQTRGEVIDRFSDFLMRQPSRNIIFGCTEFPILYDEISDGTIKKSICVFDPLEATLDCLREEFLRMNSKE